MEKSYRRQFVIGKKALGADDVRVIALWDGLSLSYQQDLRVQSIRGQSSQSDYLLLGYAIQSMPGEADPEELLARESFASLGEAVATWSGRWCLIANECVYTDVCGLCGLFYANGEASGPVISTSLAWLKDEYGFTLRADYQPVAYHTVMGYFPGPSSVYDGVYKLMNTQYLCYEDGAFAAKPTDALRLPEGDRETLLRRLREALACYFRNCNRVFPEIYLPLSGGLDSRTNLSALIQSGVPFRAYTCVKKKMTHSDRHIPPKLCAKCGIRHEYIRPSGTPEQQARRLRLFDAHTCGQCVDRDREYYGAGQYPRVASGQAMLVGGGLWQFSHKDVAPIGENAERLIEKAKAISPCLAAMLNEYMAYVREHPLSAELSLFDRFYVEQRLGCWLSSIEQALDLIDGVRLHPMNCAYMLSLYIRLTQCYAKPSDAEKDVIRENAPELLAYPFNAKSPYEKMNDRVTRIRKKLRRMF